MKQMKCLRCDYAWIYKGILRRATCPNCGIKVHTSKFIEYVEEEETDSDENLVAQDLIDAEAEALYMEQEIETII